MTQSRPDQVAHAYLDAIKARDFERARHYLADDRFSQRSPIGVFQDADAYVADMSRVGAILEGIEHRHTFVDGNDVCLVVNYVTRMDGRQVTPVVHWMHVDGDKIRSIETFFDARGYDDMYPEGPAVPSAQSRKS